MRLRALSWRVHTPITPVKIPPVSCARPLRPGLALLGAAFVLALIPLKASARTLHIYMYSAQGAPVEMSQSYVYQEPYVYDLAGNPVGSVNAQNVICNAAGQQIGFVIAD